MAACGRGEGHRGGEPAEAASGEGKGPLLGGGIDAAVDPPILVAAGDGVPGGTEAPERPSYCPDPPGGAAAGGGYRVAPPASEGEETAGWDAVVEVFFVSESSA